MEQRRNIIEIRDIVKTFPGVRALSNVNISIKQGEIHALCGENGAGKSTLIKILAGVYPMDSGTYLFDGKEVNLHSTHEGIRLGISCIYQELSVVPLLDVSKNLFLGNYPTKKNGLLDNRRMYQESKEILRQLNLDISPKTLVGNLSIAQQQLIEIGRALTRKAKVIVMDEPTSSLTNKETEILFQIINQLRDNGVTIIYISHKLEEVLRICNRITIMRDGESIKTLDTQGVTKEQLISFMIGRPLDNLFNKMRTNVGSVVMRVNQLTKLGTFENICFDVREGEILGFYGLVGAGRTEIMESIFGIRSYDSGEIYIKDQKAVIRNPKQAIQNGIALVPEDRKGSGLSPKLNVLQNITIVILKKLSRFGILQDNKQKAIAAKYIADTHIKTPSMQQTVVNLSGGNQQKIVISKWLAAHPLLLILDEPTRGIDVGAKAEIYGLISQLASTGVAVIIVSSEMQEIFGCCDRVITIAQGKKTGDFLIENTSSDQVLAAAFGGNAI